MGNKRGTGRGAFIDSVLELVEAFYGDVLQHVKAWAAAPPRLREPIAPIPTRPAALVSTAHSSQDGPEPTTSHGAQESAIDQLEPVVSDTATAQRSDTHGETGQWEHG